MERNLDRRVEALVPVTEPALQARLRTDRRGHARPTTGAPGSSAPTVDWRRVETLLDAPTGVDTFEVFKAQARASVQVED